MSLTSYRTAPPRGMGSGIRCRRPGPPGDRVAPGRERNGRAEGCAFRRGCLISDHWRVIYWSGGDLLSHVLRRSTIGATGLNGRVRDGIGCFPRAVTTRPSKGMHASSLKVWFLSMSKPQLRFFGSTFPPLLPTQPPMVPGHDRWLGGEEGREGGARRKRQLSKQAHKNQTRFRCLSKPGTDLTEAQGRHGGFHGRSCVY